MADPGLRRELIIALIKSLPKPVRRNFVPAPNYAEAFLGRATPPGCRCSIRWSASCVR